MRSFTVHCDTFSNNEKVPAVVTVSRIEETCSEAKIALSFSTLLAKCLMKILGRSGWVKWLEMFFGGCLFESVLTIWCSYLLDDARAIPSE